VWRDQYDDCIQVRGRIDRAAGRTPEPRGICDRERGGPRQTAAGFVTRACPWCGAALDPAAVQRSAACKACGASYRFDGAVLSWAAPHAPQPAKRDWRRLALRQLNPIASRLSPLRYFSDWRIEQYYRRTLSDAELASDWGQHYLGGLRLEPGAPVLDHGCGRGRNIALLSRLGFQVAAQDIQPHAWWHTLANCSFQTVPAIAPRLPWTSNAFAVVLDVGVIHYLTEPQLATLSREVFRVLAPGGHWVLLEANDGSYGRSTFLKTIGRLHPLQAVRRLILEVGFIEVDLRYEGFYAAVFPIAVNFVRKLMQPGSVDLSDYRSTLGARTPPERRGLWQLRLRKPGTGD
jgi:SAM-dependent methyltransferase